MSEEPKFALFNDYRWQVMPVVKQTDKTITVLDGKRERRKSLGDVVISTDHAALVAAAERLTSSDALAMDDRRKAVDRNRERNAAILAEVTK